MRRECVGSMRQGMPREENGVDQFAPRAVLAGPRGRRKQRGKHLPSASVRSLGYRRSSRSCSARVSMVHIGRHQILRTPQLDFIENHRASPPRLDVKDCFLPEDFVGSFESKPELSEVSERTPASAHVGPIEQLEAI